MTGTTLQSELDTNPWAMVPARIMEITPEIEGVATYRLCAVIDQPAGFHTFQPGQFNMLYLPGVGESAISMSGDAEATQGWVHTVRVAGRVTGALARLSPGATLGVRGPFGRGWPMNDLVGDDLLVIAGGLGLAPLRPLIYHLLRHRADFGRIGLIIGARAPGGLLYRQEYDDWRRNGLEVQVTVDRAEADWSGNIGVVTTLLDRWPLVAGRQTRVVMCGPEVMMKYAAQTAMRRGITAERIWVSLERNMQCAVGLCGHCQLGPAFLCKDGPVLRYDRIAQYLMVESL